jgi:sucrose-6-phosphate hydrolase SacC (GH32 family)
VGHREGEKFIPEQHVRMNWPGGQYFAPESAFDGKGRRIFWAWVTDPRIRPAQDRTGSGFQSLPRIMSLDKGGNLCVAPAPELEALRKNPRQLDNLSVAADTEKVLDGIRGKHLELALDIDTAKAVETGLKVRCTPDAEEETAVWYDANAKTLRVDVSKSTTRKDLAYGETVFIGYNTQKEKDIKKSVLTFSAPLTLAEGETLKLQVFLDGPMLEVFANGRQCVTQVVYPKREDALDIKVCAKGGPVIINSAKAWDMAPLNFEDKRGK